MPDNSNITDMATRKPYKTSKMVEYIVTYDGAEHGSKEAIIYAKDADDAEYQLRALKINGRVECEA